MDVLVPVNDSEPARAAVEHALEEYPDASITLLHVIDPNLSTYGEGGVYAYESLIESRKEGAEELLEELGELASDHDGTLTGEIVVGQPGREVVEFAEEGGHDHIIIGSHGRSGASRVLLGSVAESVARRASVPVTIVR
ncbi:universal stress protein [Natronolimnohabitans sp. A-GB9]|uniref:universal stress protein n=1 Tax=Natronolimnohabitans sp. A-GB9 TaxID=3069757 RepID=UPI0027B5E5E8|nr:universal stress protein [Natronolimnohabitans sp. A-GB9]MDQ2049250.1 universal stress protein [Natronolimnohabitans sp. A-GB9]